MSSDFAMGKANIVILARNYNPSIVSKEWLYEKDIIRETVRNFVHTPVMSLIETESISIVIEQERLQISLKNINYENIDALPRIATEFVSALPETPYVGLGFNYHYGIPKENIQLEALFSPDNSKLKELFSEDYEIGQQVFFRFEGFTVRMSAAPKSGEDAKLSIGFNFHADTPGAKKVIERLKLYANTKEKAEEILRGMSK